MSSLALALALALEEAAGKEGDDWDVVDTDKDIRRPPIAVNVFFKHVDHEATHCSLES